MTALRALWRRWWKEPVVAGSKRKARAFAAADTPRCGACRHFRDDPADIEAALPGLSSLSSAHASVRGDDGLCRKHDRFVTARSSCGAFRLVGG